MKQYLVSVIHPYPYEPGAEAMDQIGADVDALNAEMQAAGAWVFAAGLHEPSTATVLRVSNGAIVTTDGPFAEGKEHIGGFWVINAPDLDAALAWGAKATRACQTTIEVRPVHGEEA